MNTATLLTHNHCYDYEYMVHVPCSLHSFYSDSQGTRYDAGCRIFLSDEGLSNFGPFFLLFLLKKGIILGFAPYVHFMGYRQYKICFRKGRPISSTM